MDKRLQWVLLAFISAYAGSASAQVPWRSSRQAYQQQQQIQFPCFDNLPLSKLMLNQSGYIQYAYYFTPMPAVSSFTIQYWFNLITTDRSSTMFDYSHFQEGRNSSILVQLQQGNPQRWSLIINDQLVTSMPSPLIRTGEWHHIVNSWDSQTGTFAVYMDGNILGAQTGLQGRGIVIPPGGQAWSGQRQNTINGMDRREGLEGWFTLFQMSGSSFQQPYSRETLSLVARMARQCDGSVHGDIISWTRTPRKDYGGIMETPSRTQCGNF